MLKRLNITDYVILIFLVLTGIIILSGSEKTENFTTLIIARVIAISTVFVLIKLNEVYKNRIVSLLRYFYPLIFTAYFYGETGYYNNIFFNNLDDIFINLDKLLFGFQPSLLFSVKYSSTVFSELMFFSYFSYYFIIAIPPLIIYFTNRKEFGRVFFIIIFSFYIYYFIFAIFPVVGPQFYFNGADAEIAHHGFWGKLIGYIQESGETPTGAFPSSHVGISWVILFALLKSFKKLSLIILPFALLICLSTVYIKAHYAVDVIGGLISAVIFYFAADIIFKRFKKVKPVI